MKYGVLICKKDTKGPILCKRLKIAKTVGNKGLLEFLITTWDTKADQYKLKDLLSVLHIAKSSYCYNAAVLRAPDKYADVRRRVTDLFYSVSKRYGYRRIHVLLKRENITVSEKVVRRIMQEENLVVPFVKMKKYSSYVGEVTPAVENLVKRDFHADKPNELWLTDITEFHIPAGKIYRGC